MGDVTAIDGRKLDEKNAETDAEAVDDGRALDDMTEDDFIETIPGTESQMTFGYVSPFDVVQSTLKIAAIAPMPVRGQYKDGDKLSYTVTVEVEETAFKPVYDKDKRRVGTRRHHVARVVSVDPVEAD